MITPAALKHLCFPWILIDKNGVPIQEGNGSLFPSPHKEIESVLSSASIIENGGWGVCKHGFAIYKFSTNIIAPASIILHGLKVDGISAAKGRSVGLSINLKQSDVSSYASEFCES